MLLVCSVVSDSLQPFCQPGYHVHKISQARILKWVAISFSRGSSQPRDWTRVSLIAGRRFTAWATREVQSPVPFWPLFLCLPRWLFFQIGNQKQSLRLVSTLFFLPYTLSFWKALTHVALWRQPWKPACSSWTLFQSRVTVSVGCTWSSRGLSTTCLTPNSPPWLFKPRALKCQQLQGEDKQC